MSERFKPRPDQIDFGKRKNPFLDILNKIKQPPKGKPEHIRPPQIQNPVQKPHRQPNNRNNRRK